MLQGCYNIFIQPLQGLKAIAMRGKKYTFFFRRGWLDDENVEKDYEWYDFVSFLLKGIHNIFVIYM